MWATTIAIERCEPSSRVAESSQARDSIEQRIVPPGSREHFPTAHARSGRVNRKSHRHAALQTGADAGRSAKPQRTQGQQSARQQTSRNFTHCDPIGRNSGSYRIVALDICGKLTQPALTLLSFRGLTRRGHARTISWALLSIAHGLAVWRQACPRCLRQTPARLVLGIGSCAHAAERGATPLAPQTPRQENQRIRGAPCQCPCAC